MRKSLVMLKNGKNETDPLLPLPKKPKKILVAGSHADNLGYQCGGWTIAWQGFSGNNYTRGTTAAATSTTSLCLLLQFYLRMLKYCPTPRDNGS